MKSTITKRYSRKLTYNYNSEEFSTEETRDVEYGGKEEYTAAHDKLAAQVKALTLRDLDKHSELLKEAEAAGDAVRVQETVSA
jgi:hypothetical protein